MNVDVELVHSALGILEANFERAVVTMAAASASHATVVSSGSMEHDVATVG